MFFGGGAAGGGGGGGGGLVGCFFPTSVACRPMTPFISPLFLVYCLVYLFVFVLLLLFVLSLFVCLFAFLFVCCFFFLGGRFCLLLFFVSF